MDQKIDFYFRYSCLLLSITLALLYVAHLRTNQHESLDRLGIVISYPKSLPKNGCGSVKISIDESQVYFSEMSDAILASSGEFALEQNSNVTLEAALVFPGMSVEPAGAIKIPWIDASEQSISWQVCSNTEGTFDGTIWIYVYFLTGQDHQIEKLPLSAYPIKVKVMSKLGYVKAGNLVLFVSIIAGMCILWHYLKSKVSNKKT